MRWPFSKSIIKRLQMLGHIHSTESFGTVDGPGTRFVIFFQGCPMRCQYCHNPDTWEVGGGTLRSVEDLLAEYDSCKEFYKSGGITTTGGEPMLQLDFLIELYEAAHAKGIHTCLDTSGIVFNASSDEFMKKLDRLLAVTDLVMLDIKHIDNDCHKILCQQPNTGILAFARYLSEKQIPVWIRHVIVPGFTNEPGELKRLGAFLAELHNVKALDVLPYHTMGKPKYEKLGIPYPLGDTPDLSAADAVAARNIIISAWKAKKAFLNAKNDIQ